MLCPVTSLGIYWLFYWSGSTWVRLGGQLRCLMSKVGWGCPDVMPNTGFGGYQDNPLTKLTGKLWHSYQQIQPCPKPHFPSPCTC